MEKIIKSKLAQKLSIAIFAALFIFIYLYRLDLVPVHLNQDEMMFGLNAYSIAKYGKDFYGNAYPFYFWHLGVLWATPLIVYCTSLFLRFLPFAEETIRISNVFIGTVSILLLAILSKKIFKDNFYSFITLMLVGTVPVLFINSRVLVDNIWPIPFVIVWLIFLRLFIDKSKLFYLFLAGLSLGVGIHSYHAAKLMMPIYLALTITYLVWAKKISFRSCMAVFIGFAIPIVVFLPWLKAHPDTLLNQVSYISWMDKSVNVSDGFFGVFNLGRLRGFLSNYFTYFSPKILFLEGDRSLIHSTGRIGAFSFGIVFLLVFGIVEVLTKKKDFFSKIILLGFLTYPVAPSIVNDPQRISRGLVVVPFVVLLSTYGVYFLISRKEKVFKYLLSVVLVFILFDFTFFLHDYFGDYRLRSSHWFNGSIGKVYELAVEDVDNLAVKSIYIDQNIYFAENYFDFYQIKKGADLKSKTVYFDPTDRIISNIPAGSLVVVNSQDKVNFVSDPDFVKVQDVLEPDGQETFLVYYKE